MGDVFMSALAPPLSARMGPQAPVLPSSSSPVHLGLLCGWTVPALAVEWPQVMGSAFWIVVPEKRQQRQ